VELALNNLKVVQMEIVMACFMRAIQFVTAKMDGPDAPGHDGNG
jgi:hypothetical protein